MQFDNDIAFPEQKTQELRKIMLQSVAKKTARHKNTMQYVTEGLQATLVNQSVKSTATSCLRTRMKSESSGVQAIYMSGIQSMYIKYLKISQH